MAKEVYYSDYLQLDKILNAQEPESAKTGKNAPDEMLFIIIHQAYELWFKQILFGLERIQTTFEKSKIDDNSRELAEILHIGNRITTILKLLVQQIDVMETMTSMDFLDFRDFLRPASGFQSVQFKQIEAILGLKEGKRHGKGYYLSQLKKEHVYEVKKLENEKSIIELVDEWLCRMPFMNAEKYWHSYKPLNSNKDIEHHVFWNDYRYVYSSSLLEKEKPNLASMDTMLFTENTEGQLSASAKRNALFITLYRDYPLLQLPYQILNFFLEVDELLSMWRFRHINMVNRIIGKRIGTGGSSGADYLSKSLQSHYIFDAITGLSTFLIERKNLPELPVELKEILSYKI